MTGFKFDNVNGEIYYNDIDYLTTVSGVTPHASNHLDGGIDDLLSAPGDIGVTVPGVGKFTTISGENVISLKETTTPGSDEGYGKIYTKSNNLLYFQSGDGIEHMIEAILNALMWGTNMWGTNMWGINMFKQM